MNIRNGLILTTAIAAALAVGACSPNYNSSYVTDRDTSVCTDRQGRRVDDSYCARGYRGGGGYGLMYLNSGRTIPAYGSTVYGGSRTAVAGRSYAPSASVARSVSVARGGFGSSARGGFGGFSAGS